MSTCENRLLKLASCCTVTWLIVSWLVPILSAGSSSSSEQQFLLMVNNARATAGVPTLVVDSRLSSAAKWFADDLGTDGIPCGHVDSLGRGVDLRVEDFGYPEGSGPYVAENSACSSNRKTAKDLFAQMWGSVSHRNAMLDSSRRTAGVGMGPGSGDFANNAVIDMGPDWIGTPTPGVTISPSPIPTGTATLIPSATPGTPPPGTATPEVSPTKVVPPQGAAKIFLPLAMR